MSRCSCKNALHSSAKDQLKLMFHELSLQGSCKAPGGADTNGPASVNGSIQGTDYRILVMYSLAR